MGYIYSISFPSGKMYIGQTVRSVEKRISEHLKCEGHCILLENAIRKYGSESIKTEILLEINDNCLNMYEIMFIETYNTLEPHGYNIRTGGSHGHHSEESKERMRQSKLGEKNHNFGKNRSIETKKQYQMQNLEKNITFTVKNYVLIILISYQKRIEKPEQICQCIWFM